MTDAIESGIVKVPRVPVQDATGQPEPKYFQLWKTIQSEHKAHAGARKMKPEEIYSATEAALLQLAGQWKNTFDEMTNHVGEGAIPPVLIVVCNDKKSSQIFFEKISGEREIAAVATIEDVEEFVVSPSGESIKQESELNSPDGETTNRGAKHQKSKTQTAFGPGLNGFPEFWNSETSRRTIRIDTDALRSRRKRRRQKNGRRRRVAQTHCQRRTARSKRRTSALRRRGFDAQRGLGF